MNSQSRCWHKKRRCWHNYFSNQISQKALKQQFPNSKIAQMMRNNIVFMKALSLNKCVGNYVLCAYVNTYVKTKQNKTKQHITKHHKTKQNKTKQTNKQTNTTTQTRQSGIKPSVGWLWLKLEVILEVVKGALC